MRTFNLALTTTTTTSTTTPLTTTLPPTTHELPLYETSEIPATIYNPRPKTNAFNRHTTESTLIDHLIETTQNEVEETSPSDDENKGDKEDWPTSSPDENNNTGKILFKF